MLLRAEKSWALLLAGDVWCSTWSSWCTPQWMLIQQLLYPSSEAALKRSAAMQFSLGRSWAIVLVEGGKSMSSALASHQTAREGPPITQPKTVAPWLP